MPKFIRILLIVGLSVILFDHSTVEVFGAGRSSKKAPEEKKSQDSIPYVKLREEELSKASISELVHLNSEVHKTARQVSISQGSQQDCFQEVPLNPKPECGLVLPMMGTLLEFPSASEIEKFGQQEAFRNRGLETFMPGDIIVFHSNMGFAHMGAMSSYNSLMHMIGSGILRDHYSYSPIELHNSSLKASVYRIENPEMREKFAANLEKARNWQQKDYSIKNAIKAFFRSKLGWAKNLNDEKKMVLISNLIRSRISEALELKKGKILSNLAGKGWVKYRQIRQRNNAVSKEIRRKLNRISDKTEEFCSSYIGNSLLVTLMDEKLENQKKLYKMHPGLVAFNQQILRLLKKGKKIKESDIALAAKTLYRNDDGSFTEFSNLMEFETSPIYKKDMSRLLPNAMADFLKQTSSEAEKSKNTCK